MGYLQCGIVIHLATAAAGLRDDSILNRDPAIAPAKGKDSFGLW